MNTHRVILAGAGPGDEKLVTLKLIEALQEADVLLVDRLVNPKILDLYANKNAEIISVGKQGYAPLSHTQEQINNLIIEHTRNGKIVMRLKGGDVAIYSNMIEEILVCQKNNIPYEIIPGITAASGIAATLGISLTGRSIAPGVQFHSLSTNDAVKENISVWAKTKDTLVFYMSTLNLKSLVIKLVEAGSENKSIAIIEQGTTPFQKNTYSTLFELVNKISDSQVFQSPTLIIIGDILKLSIPQESVISNEYPLAFFGSLNSQNIKLHAL